MAVLEFITGLQSAAEWQAWILLVPFVLCATEFLKRAWRRFYSRFQCEDIWFISTLAGLMGAWFLWPPDSIAPWWIIGFIGSGIASISHTWALVLVRWKAPTLAAMITGERRRTNGAGPTDGGDRRRPKKPLIHLRKRR